VVTAVAPHVSVWHPDEVTSSATRPTARISTPPRRPERHAYLVAILALEDRRSCVDAPTARGPPSRPERPTPTVSSCCGVLGRPGWRTTARTTPSTARASTGAPR
jgi:hypothetical protein